MIFNIDRKPLLAALTRVAGIVPKRATIPILSHVLITAHKDGRLVFQGTSLDIEAVVTVRDVAVTKAGATSVSADMLLNIAKNAADGAEIHFELKDRLAIKSGKSRFNLATLAPEDFPKFAAMDEPVKFDMPAEDLERLFNSVAYAQGIDQARQYLMGVYLWRDDDEIIACGTDGKQLALTTAASAIDQDFRCIVPAQMVAEVGRGLASEVETVSLEINRAKIKIEAGGVQITSKLLDFECQDFRRVIPKEDGQTLRINSAALSSAINRVSLAIEDEKSNSAKMIVSAGLVSVSTRNQEAEAADDVECDWAGDPMTIGINCRHMLGALTACGTETVELVLINEKVPVRVRAVPNGELMTMFSTVAV